VLGVDVPPVSHVTIWGAGPLGINKTVLIYLFALIATVAVFYFGTRKKDALVPSGILQNTAESSIGFVRNQIIMQTMGVDGLGYLPYLATLFFFIFFSNITEIIPGVQFPANARFGVPLVLALLTWVIFNVVGIARQGAGHYFVNSVFPPLGDMPVIAKIFMYVLLAPIEFLSTFIIRPFSLMVRLFANMLAGHMLLVTFALLTHELIKSDTLVLKPVAVLPFFMLLFLVAFEVLVGFLQAYIFTILTAVYIAQAAHPEH
jgi:F-type H+-transporting ATPase subunit a